MAIKNTQPKDSSRRRRETKKIGRVKAPLRTSKIRMMLVRGEIHGVWRWAQKQRALIRD